MKTYPAAVVVAAVLAVAALLVAVQSRTIQFGRFSWTHVGLLPFSGKALHVVKYEDETLCARLLDETRPLG